MSEMRISFDEQVDQHNNTWISYEKNIYISPQDSNGLLEFSLSTVFLELYDYFSFNVRIFVGNRNVEIVEFKREFEKIHLKIQVPKNYKETIVKIKSDYAARPSERGMNEDSRELSVIISDIKYERSELGEPSGTTHTRTALSSPIFVIGTYRSGTSILSWALGQHPNIFPLEETNWIPSTYYGAMAGYRLASAASVSAVRTYNLSITDFLRRQGDVIDKLHRDLSWGRAKENLFQRLTISKDEYDSRFQMLRSPRAEKRRWVDGTPENTSIAIGLADMFPDSLFVGTIRSPERVIKSLMKFDNLGQSAYSFEDAASTWETMTQWEMEALYRLGPERMLLIKQSDMETDPNNVLENIFDFLGEPKFRESSGVFSKRINSSGVNNIVFSEEQIVALERLEKIYSQIVRGKNFMEVDWTRKIDDFESRCNHIVSQWIKNIGG